MTCTSQSDCARKASEAYLLTVRGRTSALAAIGARAREMVSKFDVDKTLQHQLPSQ